MPYTVDRYRSNAFTGQPGWPLVINDSNINSGNTSLKIIGRGVPNYGEFIAENFVHILENFAGTIPPDNPITGQIWYQTNPQLPGVGTLRVFNGVEFTPVTGGSSGPTFPTTATVGQIHLLNNKLFIFNSTSWVPLFPYTQGPVDPASAQLGDLFFNTAQNTVKIRIDDSGPQWRSLVSITGNNSTQNNNLGVSSGFYLHKSIDANVAALGTNQAGAALLSNNINVVTSASTLQRCVRFDSGVNIPIGTELTIINDTAITITIFPPNGATIDDLGANNGFNLGSKARITMIKATELKFYSITSIYA